MALQDLIDKSITAMGKGIHPVVRESAVELIKRAFNEGIYIRIVQGHRTFEEQAEIYGKGRKSYIYKGKNYGDPRETIVSNAKPGSSNHNYGLAIDFALSNKDGTEVYWTVNDNWRHVITIAKQLGFASGIDFRSFIAPPHLEMMGGLSIRDLQNGKSPNLKVNFLPSPPPSAPPAKPIDNKEENTMAKYSPSVNRLRDATLISLNRFSNKQNNPISKEWYAKVRDGEISESDAIGLIYYAIENGFIGNGDLLIQMSEQIKVLTARVAELEEKLK